jgi:hypothetical protein
MARERPTGGLGRSLLVLPLSPKVCARTVRAGSGLAFSRPLDATLSAAQPSTPKPGVSSESSDVGARCHWRRVQL